MVGFRTKNSVYYVNEQNKTITGGIFKDRVLPYTQLIAIIGFKAQITLNDGSYFETSQVKSYL